MNAQFRQEYFPTDPISITESMKRNEACKAEKHQLRTELTNVCKELQNSVHWGTVRYQVTSLYFISFRFYT